MENKIFHNENKDLPVERASELLALVVDSLKRRAGNEGTSQEFIVEFLETEIYSGNFVGVFTNFVYKVKFPGCSNS